MSGFRVSLCDKALTGKMAHSIKFLLENVSSFSVKHFVVHFC